MDQYNNNDNRHAPIYSKMAVLGFCIFFNPVFGGVLLRQNLIDIGKPREGLNALLFSALLFMFTAFIGTFILKFLVSSIFVCNLVGGAVLVEYYYRKYFPDEAAHPKKGILRPLLISLMLTFLLFILLFSQGVKVM